MISVSSLLTLVHLTGLALAVGCASAKLALLFKSRSNQSFLPPYIAVSRPITKLLITGIILLTLSGIGWLIIGYDLTPLLIAKLVLVVVIWALGPIIDNVLEPKFRDLAPQPGAQATASFLHIQQRYVLVEAVATGLFYIIIVMWVLG